MPLRKSWWKQKRLIKVRPYILVGCCPYLSCCFYYHVVCLWPRTIHLMRYENQTQWRSDQHSYQRTYGVGSIFMFPSHSQTYCILCNNLTWLEGGLALTLVWWGPWAKVIDRDCFIWVKEDLTIFSTSVQHESLGRWEAYRTCIFQKTTQPFMWQVDT